MGFKEAGLYTEYEKLHPDIKIAENVTERNENYYPALLNHLTTNSGLMDVQAIEVGNIAEVVATQAAKFEDMSKVSGVDKSKWLDWKWSQGTTKDGQTIALGTDVGPMALCYRKDLFQAAGLPTDREAVGKLWAGDWNKFIATGEQYKSKAKAGTFFMDSPGGLINAILSSEKEKFYDSSGEIIYKTNPAVKAAFDLTAKAAEEGLVQAQTQFQPAWDTTIANSKFATIACPPWMLGTIKGKAKAEDSRQVGRGRRTQVRQLGRLLPGCAEERQAREGGRGVHHLADRARAAGEAVQGAGLLPEHPERLHDARGDRREERHDR